MNLVDYYYRKRDWYELEVEWTCEGERPEGNDARSLKEEGSVLLESLASFFFSMVTFMNFSSLNLSIL